MSSLLERKLTPQPRRRSHRGLYITIGVIVVLIASILLFTNVSNDIAFITHFVSPPKHFTYSGHSDYISSVAWSPDSKRIASASGDRTVQVWDAADGSHVLTYRGHTDDVATVAWSPDGQLIASGGLDNTVQVWNAVTGARVFTYTKHTDAVYNVVWSPDGKRIASASQDGTVQIWDATTGEHVVTFTGLTPVRGALGAKNAVAWSPDGKYLAIGGEGPVTMLNAATAQIIGYYGPHGGASHAVAFSPDGTYLAVGRDDSSVQVWNVANPTNPIYTYGGHMADIFAVTWSPDSKRIASGGEDSTVQVWDALTGNHAFTYRGHLDYYWGHFTSNQYVNTVAWSPDGKLIASGSSDDTLQVWAAP